MGFVQDGPGLACDCPPVGVPPATYLNPFRVDANNCLWFDSAAAAQCDPAFLFLGTATYAVPATLMSLLPGSPSIFAPNFYPAGPPGVDAPASITNTLNCDIQVMLGLDMQGFLSVGDMQTTNYLILHGYEITGLWGGTGNSTLCGSTQIIINGGMPGVSVELIRQPLVGTANAFNVPLILSPGGSVTITSRVAHIITGPQNPTDTIEIVSAIRAYGYVI